MKNIIFLTTDEQHIRSLSYYGAAGLSTPNIDMLLREGENYTNAYTVSPVCLPSRCSWMTGMSPHCNGSLSNNYGASLSLQYPNLFTELKKAGYHTSLHGKCHFVPVPYAATRPDRTYEYEHFLNYYRSLGIDCLDVEDGKNVSVWFYDDYGKYLEKHDMLYEYKKQIQRTPSNKCVFDFPFDSEDHPDVWTGRKAIERIETAPDGDNFVWCSFAGPHYPVDTPAEYTEMVDETKMDCRVFSPTEYDVDNKFHFNGYHGPGTTEGSNHAEDKAQKNFNEEYWRRWKRHYLGNVVLIDSMIGRIKAAAEKKWKDNYIIIFTSDHGEMMGNHSLWGKNGSLFEDVLRVPLAIYDPEKKGSCHNERVSSLDVFPSIMKIAGVTPHDKCEGRALDEIVNEGGRDIIFSECENRIAVLKGNYKLEWNFYEPRGKMYREFYDLGIDPNEFMNLYYDPEYKKIIEELESFLEEKEKKEGLLSSVFYDFKSRPYYLNNGEGAGLKNNR